MTIQFSVAVRNARLDAFESTVGTSAKLRLYSGSPPVDCATAASGTMLCEISLPSDYMASASGGTKSKLGTWTGSAAAAGTVGYFRIWDSAVSACHEQGTVTIAGSGGDMTLDNNVLAVAQVVTINTFSMTDANA